MNTTQRYSLLILRLMIGWHLLYEGIVKLLTPGWSSIGFLGESQWIMSDIAKWIISNEKVLKVADFLNIWGLIIIGLGLILGLFKKYAAYSGALLLFVYYLNNPPLIGLEYSMPTEGHYMIISKTLIEAVALIVIALFSSGDNYALDSLISKLYKNK